MRALVVEDEGRLAELLRRGLDREGYEVALASDGMSGLGMVLDRGYDAVVLDAMLPGLDGFEFCRRMRQEGCWTPVLMLTARDSVVDRIRGLDSGADDYLTKPFEFGELTARLRALVRRGWVARAVPLRVGDLQLDPAAMTASRGDTPIELTAKELALLELLMRHSGEVLTRSRILEELWDFASYPNSNVVDQYVGYLRRKVDKPFGRSDIETVRGSGYRLRTAE